MTNTTSPTERVGRYQLLDPIGFGPSGAVSRAKVFGVAGFERQFAVKRLHAELTATAAMAAMLSAAARAYGSLEHPRIARMSEFGVAQGSTFTAVEYVAGLDALRLIGEARLAGVTLAAGGALALVSQAARAVGYAHGRGLTHLGLAPTNVIITADGDIKITDFGILSATLPPRPIDAQRLAQRIPYLAPEQLANEATSAATDVFALGVLAYELVTGSRTFKGDTPQQIASAIMAGPPAEPPLPRPIVRVLQRCLARSPFERFPDARALADALDAALRVAPVPGTRKDIGAQVKETLDRLAALNEGQMSGVVALHLGTGPVRRLDDDARPPPHGDADLETVRDTGDSLAYELARPEAPPGVPPPFGGPATTQPDLPRYPMTTVPGLAPPPIPVPQGFAGPPSAPLPASPGANTLLGIGKSPPVIPAMMSRPGPVSAQPTRPPAVPGGALRALTRPSTDLAIPLEPAPGAGPAATTESAIHTLDSSDLVSLDPRTGDPVELDAMDDHVPPHEAPEPPDAPDSERSATSTDAPDEPRSTYRLDPSTIDTRPIAPIVLEPLLFDPIDRPNDQPNDRRPELGAGLDDDTVTVDDSHRAPPPGSGTASADAPGPQMGPQMPAAASVDPRLGKTILGFASPLSRPAAAPHSQTPSIGTNRPPPSEADPADEISEIAPGAFRATPAADRVPPAAWPQDSLEAPTAELGRAARESDVAPMVRPPGIPADMPQPGFATTGGGPPGQTPPGWVAAPPLPRGSRSATYRAARPRRPLTGIIAGMVGAAIVGVAAWQIYVRVVAPPATRGSGTHHVATASDAQAPTAAGDAGNAVAAAAPPPGDFGDAAHSASPPGDIGSAAVAIAVPGDAGRVAVAAPGDAGRVAMAAPGDAGRVAVVAPGDAGRVAVVAPSDARLAGSDATRLAGVSHDAGGPPSDARLAPSDANQLTAVAPGAPVTPGDTLSIASTPPGARVFLDGSDTGSTPLKLPGSPDRHTIALLLAGHELYVAQVDGHGTFQIPLKEVTPSNGPAGIKVLRCKDKDRYYVFVDGKPTGQTCPTERIGCELGPHTVEVYDVVSETRRKWDIAVKETRLSFRVRVE